MNAAAAKFKDLGISELVVDLELSKLANHIASALRGMTAKKQRRVNGKSRQRVFHEYPEVCLHVQIRRNFSESP